MRKREFFFTLAVAALTASSASAQCYEFAGPGATLEITISAFTLKNGPNFSNGTGYITSDIFESSNSLTIGGTTLTSVSAPSSTSCFNCLQGTVNFSYQPGGGAVTAFTIEVPANDAATTGNTWSAVLGGVGDVIPKGVLPSPQDFPPISSWVLPIDENNVFVNGGPNAGMYPMTSVGQCTGAAAGPPSIGAVVSASAFGGFSSVAPGSWVEIYGTNLAPDTREWGGADFNGNAAPTSLDGVTVSIGGQAAFIDYIASSPGQINAQLPSNIATGGPLDLTVTNGSATSKPFSIMVNATQPGLLATGAFKIGGNQYVVAILPDGSYVLPTGSIAGVKSRPAKPGETITMYGIGFGSVTPAFPAGQIVTKKNQLALPFQMMFGSTPAAVPLPYFGLAPNYVGLYQFDVLVPDVPDNNLVPLTFKLGQTAGTQTLFTAVHE